MLFSWRLLLDRSSVPSKAMSQVCGWFRQRMVQFQIEKNEENWPSLVSLVFGSPSGTVGFGLGTAQLAVVVRATTTATIEAVAAAAAMVTPNYLSLF